MKNNTIDRYVTIPVGKLVKAEWNYKEEDAALSEKLYANISKNGQLENIIVRELDNGLYEIVNGNHRYDVLKRAGYSTVVAYNLGTITESQAQLIAIETNETKFETDNFKLSKLIDSIIKTSDVTAFDLTQTTAFSAREIDALLRLVNYNPEEVEHNKRQTYDDILRRQSLSSYSSFLESSANTQSNGSSVDPEKIIKSGNSILNHPDVLDFEDISIEFDGSDEHKLLKSYWVSLLKRFKLDLDGSQDIELFSFLVKSVYESLESEGI